MFNQLKSAKRLVAILTLMAISISSQAVDLTNFKKRFDFVRNDKGELQFHILSFV